MTIPSILLTVLIAVGFVFSMRYTFRSGGCAGCPGCKPQQNPKHACSGSCERCAHCTQCRGHAPAKAERRPSKRISS